MSLLADVRQLAELYALTPDDPDVARSFADLSPRIVAAEAAERVAEIDQECTNRLCHHCGSPGKKIGEVGEVHISDCPQQALVSALRGEGAA